MYKGYNPVREIALYPKGQLCSHAVYRNGLVMLQCNGRGNVGQQCNLPLPSASAPCAPCLLCACPRVMRPPQTLSSVVCETPAVMKEQTLHVLCSYSHKSLTEKLPWKLLCLCYKVLVPCLLTPMPSSFTLPISPFA